MPNVTIPTPEQLDRLCRPSLAGSSPKVIAAAERIEDMIFAGRLSSGQRLIEADLCEILDTTRGVAREALRILAGRGIIELVPRRGARVRRASKTEALQIMDVLAGVNLRAIRAFVETGLIAREDVRAALNTVVEIIERAGVRHDVPEFILGCTRYYALINHLTGNRFYNFLAASVNFWSYSQNLSPFVPPGSIVPFAANYRRGTDTIIAGDLQGAIRIFESGVDEFLDLISRDPNSQELSDC